LVAGAVAPYSHPGKESSVLKEPRIDVIRKGQFPQVTSFVSVKESIIYRQQESLLLAF
jgi:hypothetical protein